MKKFLFPWDRVLAWRHAQVRLEEAKLEQLASELCLLEDQAAGLARERGAAARWLLEAPVVSAAEYRALEPYRRASEAESVRIGKKLAATRQTFDAQRQTVLERRQAAQLLERLRDRRFQVWSAAADAETEQQAQEAYLSRWQRRDPPSRPATD